jgi:hypothetical protein
MLTKDEKKELEELRRFKEEHSSRAVVRSFAQLQSLMDSAHDPLVSIRAFRIISECLIALKDEVLNK